jgi:SH3-like domain-containing protein
MAALTLMSLLIAGLAVAAPGPSGLPLPRFASTRSAPVNVRVGPGVRYDIAWVYVKPAVPVEIIEEFDVWRKIRDADGAVGWVHESLLTGKREGLVTPWSDSGRIALRMRADDEAGVRAYLTPKFPVDIKSCDGTWCEITATDHSVPNHPTSYSGYMRQADLWGVYQNEKID